MSAGGDGRECCVCGRRDDLLPDENLPDLYTCRTCLKRVAEQNERIREGLEDEPEAEM